MIAIGLAVCLGLLVTRLTDQQCDTLAACCCLGILILWLLA